MTETMERSERVLVKYPLFKTAVARVQACFDSHDSTAEPDCCPIVGESGSGKTTIISYFASLHPRVDHKWGLEVPVLVAKVPARPTVKSFAETLLYQLGDPLWSRGNTVAKSIRLRELMKRCRVHLLALDEFQHFVDVRQANIPNDVADWLKEQVEEARLAIVVLGLQRCLEVLKQNEQLRRRFGATLRVGAFHWDAKDDRTTYRAFLRAVQEQLPEYGMPCLSDVDMAFRMHYASYGLIGYTMKIIRGAARIARCHPRRQITLRTLSESFAEHVWSERLDDPNPFIDSFDCDKAPPITLPSARTCVSRRGQQPQCVPGTAGMSIMVRVGARLLFRVNRLPGESPRGYLCRVAHEHGYGSPNALAQIAGLWVSGTGRVTGLDQDAAIRQLSHVLRLEPEEWRSMCYHHVKGPRRFKQRLFCGETVSADDLNYGSPRLCTACLREHSIWWAVWDLGLVVACPIHRCILLNQCPGCKRRVAWERPAVHKCRCGVDFRQSDAEPADPDLVAINAIIYRAARATLAQTAEADVTDLGFPPELSRLKLGALLRLVLFVGSLKDGNALRRKQRHFGATDLIAATEICRGAVALLRDWPRPLREVLRGMVPESANPATLNFSKIFGNFYRHLFRVLPRREFGFLHDAFEQFVIDDWKGFIRGQHRYFSAGVRLNSQWLTANEAEKLARMAGGQILDLVNRGLLESILFHVNRRGGRTEYWIRRESLTQWIATRDLGLAGYMPRAEAQRTLGLKNITVTAVAQTGLIRYAKGSECHFPTGYHFLREDVVRIKDAFEAHDVPECEYSKPGTLIALRHALKNYLGRDVGLPAVIRAVLAGDLVPVGHTNRFPGFAGYLFPSELLRKYRPVTGIEVPAEGFLNYGEAAAVLGVKVRQIRGLVEQNVLRAAAEYRFGLSKLLPAADVQRFAELYVATSVLAKRFRLNSVAFARYLRESGTPLLVVPLSDRGKGYAFFLRKDVAAQIQIPSPTMLREHAQRRIVTARKQHWAEHRQARETALGKPMTRVRVKHR